MIFPIIYYLLFNVAAGVVFTIYYFIKEGTLVDVKEFFWLLLFPVVGLGKWRYNRAMREEGKTEFPQSWYIWKHMKTVHWAMLIVCAVATLSWLGVFSSHFGKGMEWANHQDNPAGLMFGLMADAGILLVGALFAVIGAFGLVVFFLIFIMVPHFIKKSIETNVYHQKYLEEVNRRKQQEDL